MSNEVPADQIEQIVGVQRHPEAHWGRAVSSEQVFYILHSHQCRDSLMDLRACAYSKALDRGIDPREWAPDVPAVLMIENGWLTPDPDGVGD